REVRVVLAFGHFAVVFVSSRRRHTTFKCNWSSDVCTSDLFARWEPALPSAPGTTGRQSKAEAATSTLSARRTHVVPLVFVSAVRSEERRVGKAWRVRVWMESSWRREDGAGCYDGMIRMSGS